MAATPKPVRNQAKKILKGLNKMYKTDPDVKKAKFHHQEIRSMKKEDKKDVKKNYKKDLEKANAHMKKHAR